MLIALGFLAILPMFAGAGEAFPPQMLYVLGGLAVFSGLGAVACFSRASHPLTIRILGGAIFAASLIYVIGQARGGSQVPGQEPAANPVLARLQRRSQPGLANSLAFFALVGLPSGYAALTGRYPSWGRHAAAFGAEKKPQARR
jgi:hypothetical protein